MSHPHHTQSFSTRISEIKRLCSLARLVAQADSVSLDLHPGAWAGLAEPLIGRLLDSTANTSLIFIVVTSACLCSAAVAMFIRR